MQDEDGHFYYRAYPLMKAKAPMLHWAQATTYRALHSCWCERRIVPKSGPCDRHLSSGS